MSKLFRKVVLIQTSHDSQVQSCAADAYRACSAAMATSVTTGPAASCTADELQCGALCLPLSARCNGTSECDDGEDELNCPETPELFKFVNYALIAMLVDLHLFQMLQVAIKPKDCEWRLYTGIT
ncbi:hypothetical protein HAZT_HAZT010823 [Hyalella azteca]|uniref:Uncharacterized protein n=1 Tax=Hyalella azteca TaxID=294128 RepID=A0A6A0GSJ2_HYAAZ|nr:hypothetical protein HAZT_HAZT010823 [Hyalella azteca]